MFISRGILTLLLYVFISLLILQIAFGHVPALKRLIENNRWKKLILKACFLLIFVVVSLIGICNDLKIIELLSNPDPESKDTDERQR